nr:hypothetical protein [uncultured Allomuricauda sp.]
MGNFKCINHFIRLMLCLLITSSCTDEEGITNQEFEGEEIQEVKDDLDSSLNSVSLVSSVNTILSTQNVSSLTNRFYVQNESTPLDTMIMVVRWQDDVSHSGNAISINPTYDPSTFTGYTPPTPLSNWQKGEFDDSTNGSPVFQMNGAYGGILMNSWFTSYQSIVGGGQNTTYEYAFSSPPSPWSTGTSKLWVQADLRLPWFANWDNNSNNNYPVGQLSFFMYLKDTVNNAAIAIIVNAFDNRSSTPSETVMTDTFTYFASTRFGGTDYSTPNTYSSSWRSTTWNTYNFYRAEITRQNLINIITDINSQFSQSFSTDPTDYVLTSAGILQETFREEGDQVSMGASFRNFSIHEEY